MKKVGFLLAGLIFLLALGACGSQENKSPSLEHAGTQVSAISYLTATPSQPPRQTKEAPTPQRIPSPTPSPTLQWKPPTTLAESLQALRDALQKKDAEALSRLMLASVGTGAYATDNTWHEDAAVMAETILKGVGDAPLRCTSFSQGMGGAALELGGFHFPPGVPLPGWRVDDGSPFSHVQFSFEDEPPYRIVFVVPVPDDLWRMMGGASGSCASPAAQIFGVAEGSSSEKAGCPNSPPPRLRVGQYAYVSLSPPLPNRVRSSPSKQGRVVGWAQPGRVLEILEGPVCGDGWTWWRVRLVNSSLTGWTAEGDGGSYWLVPCKTLSECKSP